jgi:hypothetical protein
MVEAYFTMRAAVSAASAHCTDLIVRKVELQHVSEASIPPTKQSCLDGSRGGVREGPTLLTP